MSFTESKSIKQITILPAFNSVNVQWANVVKKDDEVISETFERKAYDATFTGFNTEVGALDVNAFLAAFNTATLDEKVAALAAKATAEAALTAAQAQVATLQAQIDAYTPPVPVVPSFITVSPRQIRMALTQAGLRTSVEAAVSQGSQALKDWYEFAEAFEENNANVTSMAAALGVSDEALHDLFELASGL